MQRDLVESQKLLERIQHVMDGRGRVGIFPDLASQRTKSTEIMNQLVGTRQKFAGKIRAIIDPVLTPEEKQGARSDRDRARRHRAAAVGDADHRRGRARPRAHDEGALLRDRSPGVGAERRDPGDGSAAGRDRELLPGVALRTEDPARGHPPARARHAHHDRGAARAPRQAARGDRRRPPRRDRRGRDRRGRARDDQEADRDAAARAGDREAGDGAL